MMPGKNIAMKVPLYRWEDTVAFYRDRVGLKVVRELKESTGFEFGDMTLWIDRISHQSQTDIWIELFDDNPDAALAALGSPRRDELEPLTTSPDSGPLIQQAQLSFCVKNIQPILPARSSHIYRYKNNMFPS